MKSEIIKCDLCDKVISKDNTHLSLLSEKRHEVREESQYFEIQRHDCNGYASFSKPHPNGFTRTYQVCKKCIKPLKLAE